METLRKEQEMKVTKVWPPKVLTNAGKLLGFANIQFSLLDEGDGCLTINDWRIFQGDNGEVTVGVPSKRDENDKSKYYNTLFLDTEKPEASDFLNHVTEEVAKAYRVATNQASEQKPSPSQADNSNLKENFEPDDGLLPF